MKFLPTHNSDKVATIDDEDYERLSMFEWHYWKNTVRRHYTKNRGRKVVNVPLANEVMNRCGIMFDHIDRNGLNNQKYNLREADRSQNMCNTAKKPGTSIYRGVAWMPSRSKWRARITFKYNSMHIGLFNNEMDAARAYNQRAIELFKEFANLNKDENGNVL